MFTQGMYILIANTDIIMLGYFVNEKQTVIYSVSLGLVLMMTIIITSIRSFSAPKFSQLHHENKIRELSVLARQTSKLSFILITPIVLFLIIFGQFFLKTIYGVEFISGYHPLVILALAYFIKASSGLYGIFLNMTGSEKMFSFLSFLSALLNIVLNYFLIPLYGINGAAYSNAIATVFWSLTSVFYIYKRSGLLIAYIPFYKH